MELINRLEGDGSSLGDVSIGSMSPLSGEEIFKSLYYGQDTEPLHLPTQLYLNYCWQ
jgi:hypothetical protein